MNNSPTSVHERPDTRENRGVPETREQDESTTYRTRGPLQIDVGYGDAIVPGAIELEYTLLGGLTPRVRAYPIETVAAEKVEAVTKLGMANSRMKDYYDLWLITSTFQLSSVVRARNTRSLRTFSCTFAINEAGRVPICLSGRESRRLRVLRWMPSFQAPPR